MKTAVLELKRMWKSIALLTALQLIGFAMWGLLDLSMIIGTALGILLAIGEFCMIGASVDSVIKGSASKAPGAMAAGYFLRLAVLSIAIFIAFQVAAIHPIGFILPLFYPRLAIYYNAITRKGESD